MEGKRMRGEEGGETAVGMRKRKVGGSKGGKNLTTTTWEKRSILLGKQGRNYRGTGLLPASAQPAHTSQAHLTKGAPPMVALALLIN